MSDRNTIIVIAAMILFVWGICLPIVVAGGLKPQTVVFGLSQGVGIVLIGLLGALYKPNRTLGFAIFSGIICFTVLYGIFRSIR